MLTSREESQDLAEHPETKHAFAQTAMEIRMIVVTRKNRKQALWIGGQSYTEMDLGWPCDVDK